MSITILLDRLDLSNTTALEFFGGKGQWQGKHIAKRVKEMHAWDISSINEKYLRKNMPNAFIRIGDSYNMMYEFKYRNKFDFVNYDNSPNVFGNGHIEHFDAIIGFDKLIKDEGYVAFNLLLDPISFLFYFRNFHIFYENVGSSLIRIFNRQLLLWFDARRNFYGKNKISVNLGVKTYKKFFEDHGFMVTNCSYIYRNKFLLSVMFKVKKIIYT